MRKLLHALAFMAIGVSVNAQTIYDQTANISSSGVVSNYMTDNGSLVQCADDFVIPVNATWVITSVTVRGFRNAAGPTMDSMLVEIYSDAAGVPGTIIYQDVHMLGAGGVPGPQNDTAITITIPTQTLTEGTYWLSVNGYAPQASRWNWLATTGSAINTQAQLKDADDLFGAGATNWTGFSSLALTDPNLAFTINGDDYVLNIDENEMNVSVYPNPVTDNLFIASNSAVVQHVEIYNLNGQLILQAGNSNVIDVAELQNGIYVIQVTTDKGTMNSRFVKI